MAAVDISEPSANDAFLAWFQARGGVLQPAVGLTTFPGMGRAAVALADIKKETILFALPRSLTLSTRTSSLPLKFGAPEWKKYQLHKGWVGLILCMLWEDAAGESGRWSGYLNSLPDSFQTPMFWNDEELHELKGTSVFDKIGKEEAEKDYHDKLLPAVKSRPDIFSTQSLASHYSLHRYHVMGSRILSRSFHVERWSAESEDGVDGANTNRSSDAMDVDPAPPEHEEDSVSQEEKSDGEDEDDPSDVAMVPMADMLNARYHSENAKLCYEAEELQMMSTRDIKAGEQIWNTYGDPPNSELLRRYGHVDLVPISDGVEGNPADMVEIRADLVVDVLRTQSRQTGEDPLLERIEWWLDEGGDDIFTLEATLCLPEALVCFIRLLTMPAPEWEKTRDKGKIPKPKTDPSVLRVARAVLKKRAEIYKTSIEEDDTLISTSGGNLRMAIVVRLGEKRILHSTLNMVARKMADEGNGKKRREDRDGDEARRSKKARR